MIRPSPGRSAAGEVADAVGVRPVAVGGADGDHAVGVARVGDADAAVSLAACPLAVVYSRWPWLPAAATTTTPLRSRPLALVADRRAPARVVGDVVVGIERLRLAPWIDDCSRCAR